MCLHLLFQSNGLRFGYHLGDFCFGSSGCNLHVSIHGTSSSLFKSFHSLGLGFGVSIRLGPRLGLGFRFKLLRLVCFYQA